MPTLVRQAGSCDFAIQIMPVGVRVLDKLDFPASLPLLQRLLPCDGGFHRLVRLVPDQRVDAIAASEAGDLIVPVLPDARGKAGGDANVERSVALARQDVDAWCAFSHGGIPCLDEVKAILLLDACHLQAKSLGPGFRRDDDVIHSRVEEPRWCAPVKATSCSTAHRPFIPVNAGTQ